MPKNLLHTHNPSHNNNFQAFTIFFRDIWTATPTNVYFRPLQKWRRLFHRRASFRVETRIEPISPNSNLIKRKCSLFNKALRVVCPVIFNVPVFPYFGLGGTEPNESEWHDQPNSNQTNGIRTFRDSFIQKFLNRLCTQYVTRTPNDVQVQTTIINLTIITIIYTDLSLPYRRVNIFLQNKQNLGIVKYKRRSATRIRTR